MHESAEPEREAASGVLARACTSAGSASAPAPSCPRRIIASRRWSMSHQLSVISYQSSVVKQELRAVEHGPREVFGRGAAVGRVLPQVLRGAVLLVGRRETRE